MIDKNDLQKAKAVKSILLEGQFDLQGKAVLPAASLLGWLYKFLEETMPQLVEHLSRLESENAKLAEEAKAKPIRKAKKKPLKAKEKKPPIKKLGT